MLPVVPGMVKAADGQGEMGAGRGTLPLMTGFAYTHCRPGDNQQERRGGALGVNNRDSTQDFGA